MKIVIELTEALRRDRGSHRGWAEYCLELAKSLTSLSSEHEVVFFYHKDAQTEDAALTNTFLASKATLFPIEIPKVQYDALRASKSDFYLDKLFPDADLYHGMAEIAFPVRRMAKVVTIREISPLLFPWESSEQRLTSLFQSMREIACSSDHVIAISENVRQEFIRHIHCNPSKISAISNEGKQNAETLIKIYEAALLAKTYKKRKRPAKAKAKAKAERRPILLYGDGFQSGVQLGKQAHASIKASIEFTSEAFFSEFARLRTSPYWMKTILRRLLGCIYYFTLDKHIRDFTRGVSQSGRVHGINRADLWFLNAYPESRLMASALATRLFQWKRHLATGSLNCNMIASWGKKSVEGEVICGRNMDHDFLPAAAQSIALHVIKPKLGYAYSFVGPVGTLGGVAGMNEKGLSIFEIGARTDSIRFSCSWFLHVRRTLESCSDVEGAIKALGKIEQYSFGHHFLIVDQKQARVLEVTPYHCQESGRIEENYVFRAEKPVCPDILKDELLRKNASGRKKMMAYWETRENQVQELVSKIPKDQRIGRKEIANWLRLTALPHCILQVVFSNTNLLVWWTKVVESDEGLLPAFDTEFSCYSLKEQFLKLESLAASHSTTSLQKGLITDHLAPSI